MLNALTALQTNVVATVRRDPAGLRSGNTGLSEQTPQKIDQPFVITDTPDVSSRSSDALRDQIAELIAVAQASAQSAAGIEPHPTPQSLYGRATAAYRTMNGYGFAQPQPLLNIAV